eukprot:gnl/MRDRNA2_/MRDRNA2_123772_c0_seq1.p1 gnl/MRDRNA2_/MRDRNA2_123772_c0~~gnl/MRDRNA2_/MRDRNA2_123772_c0_seq1.p1  ORF type:complete len:548 (+),score=71.45 gnl/MRDRNA2_/MRDRNA2_123772_c0_seq1:112-1755(+)
MPLSKFICCSMLLLVEMVVSFEMINVARQLHKMEEIFQYEIGGAREPAPQLSTHSSRVGVTAATIKAEPLEALPYLPTQLFGAGFADRMSEEPQKVPWSLEYVFHCGNKHFHGPLVLSQALLVLSCLALIVGLIGAWYGYRLKAETAESWSHCMNKLMLIISVYGGVLMYCCDMISDLMVIIGFGVCGYYWWMACSLSILIGAQVFAAWEFAHEEKSVGERIRKFLIAICQFHVVHNARESWSQGRITAHFARHKFIEAIWEAGPQAVFAVYVLYYLDQKDNFWLVASMFGSVCGLAWGVSVWLDFSFNKQLEDDQIPASEFCVRWYHHCMWGGYFVVDFALRLLTIGLFLSLKDLRPYNQVVFFVLVAVYLLAVLICIEVYNSEPGHETWEIFPGETIQIKRRIIAQRCVDGLILTFFVHVLPADIRLAPKHQNESRLLFALHPELRSKLMKIIIPLRALDYLGLSVTSMYFRWDAWQCAALVSMFVIMHILLFVVVCAQRPSPELSRQRSGPVFEDLPPDLQRRLSQTGTQPSLARDSSSNDQKA